MLFAPYVRQWWETRFLIHCYTNKPLPYFVGLARACPARPSNHVCVIPRCALKGDSTCVKNLVSFWGLGNNLGFGLGLGARVCAFSPGDVSVACHPQLSRW